jgi:hypothetical protein
VNIVYVRGPDAPKRYRIQYKQSYGWEWATDSYWTLFGAKLNVRIWNSIGHEARVVDTRALSSDIPPGESS